MGKKFAALQSYGTTIAVPLDLISKLVDEGYSLELGYGDSDPVTNVKQISSLRIIDADDIKAALAQQALEKG